MANFKPQKTLADYVGIAIGPMLIMVLVGSLAFFLLEVIRVSPHLGALRWTMFWYVVAIVLITRIGIEQGKTQAMGYGIAFGMATSLVILKYAGVHFLGCIVIMGLIWWCAHKLTWDCTLIDDSEDASGEGLLQVAGIEQKEQSSEDRSTQELPSDVQPPQQQKKSPKIEAAALSLVEQIRADRERNDSLWAEDAKTKKKSKPHAPGVWIVYFSLAALPLFGLGQILIPASDTARRSVAFRYLWFYVAAALALLLTTSFLGLRRYLRQRRMEMPSPVVKNWLTMGGVMILVIMVVALLLPRPNAAYSITGMIDDLSEKVQEASDRAFLKDDAGKSDAHKNPKGQTEQDRKKKSNNRQSKGKESDKAKGGKKEQGKKSDRKSQQQKDGQKKDGKKENGKGQDKQGKGDRKPQGKNKQGENKQGKQGKHQQGKKSKGGEKKGKNRKGENKQKQGKNEKQGDDQQKSDKQRKNEQNKKQKADNRADKGKQNEDDREQEQRPADEKQRQERKREEKQQSDEQRRQQRQSEQPPQQKDRESEEPKSKPWKFDWVGDLFKWILYFVIAMVVLYYLIKNWEQVVTFFRQLWHELMNLFRRNPPEKEAMTAEDTVFIEAPPPFASFRDPFLTGSAKGMHPSQVVIYTFDALESWAYENADARQKDQTPLEFAERIEMHSTSTIWNKFARLYTRTVYSDNKPNEQCYDLLRNVWQKMASQQSARSHTLEV